VVASREKIIAAIPSAINCEIALRSRQRKKSLDRLPSYFLFRLDRNRFG
jgi:hypothetical protein